MAEIKNDTQENGKVENINGEIDKIKEHKNGIDNKNSNKIIKEKNENKITKNHDGDNDLEDSKENKNEDKNANPFSNFIKKDENKEKHEKKVRFSARIYRNKNKDKDKDKQILEEGKEINKESPSELIETIKKDEQILEEGKEINKGSPSDLIKIIKKDRHGQHLPSISYDYIFKVSLIGDSSTGKTSILMRFIDDYFKEDTLSTIGVDFKIVTFELEKNIYAKMEIWDTCGSERFKSLTSSFIKTCTAFILVFDLTRLSTFKSIDNWINIIKDNTSPKFFILIGNKNDLADLREVDKDIVLEFCKKNMFNYLEISAKNNTNIEKMFKEVAYHLYMDVKKEQKVISKSHGTGSKGNFTNLQIQNDNKKEKEKEKTGCCN